MAGGVVYLHMYYPDDNRYVLNLLTAKSRVATLHNISLARLELCANLIPAKLMRIVIDTYSSRCVCAFTDSTVALDRIHSTPSRWQTFVANRVINIQDYIAPDNFYHISGKENPADC
ncbi:hypothetical protein EVAR_60880_1 [Eumeta japonica]|uniref:Uncharacterized protein n=1 Tax=Eumeta variegata TaxID=151549 RepID=A0A4C1YI42_EUMVA|nr:hypothetical protein EVAR_60880_1 [Eumeta japonica]